MATQAKEWKRAPVTTLTLPSGNQMDVRPVDMMSLVMSDNYTQIPNGLLEQISRQFNGSSADRELTCHSGMRLPDKGEPVQQGQGRDMVRGRVIDVRGEADLFTITVSLFSGKAFKVVEGDDFASTIRFGGANQAVLLADTEARWKPSATDFPQMGKFTKLIVCSAAVSPRLVETVTDPDTQLAYDDLTSDDRTFIFEWAMPSEVRPAEVFPQGQATGLPVTPDVQGIPA